MTCIECEPQECMLLHEGVHADPGHVLEAYYDTHGVLDYQ